MRLSWLALVMAAVAGSATAQDTTQPVQMGQVQSAILTIDTERLFGESAFGLRITAELQAATEALGEENRRIEAALTAEEQSLTERRPTMTPEAFRAEADAFDERVQGIRTAQDAKERALEDGVTEGRDQFLAVAAPVLGQMMRDAGAAVILDRRTVFLALSAVDITDEAIAAIDEAIGDGSGVVPDDAPDDAPEDEAPADP
jgi:Skp family chaperone for outer membrane proteins